MVWPGGHATKSRAIQCLPARIPKGEAAGLPPRARGNDDRILALLEQKARLRRNVALWKMLQNKLAALALGG